MFSVTTRSVSTVPSSQGLSPVCHHQSDHWVCHRVITRSVTTGLSPLFCHQYHHRVCHHCSVTTRSVTSACHYRFIATESVTSGSTMTQPTLLPPSMTMYLTLVCHYHTESVLSKDLIYFRRLTFGCNKMNFFHSTLIKPRVESVQPHYTSV
jgi:hypothetical protein